MTDAYFCRKFSRARWLANLAEARSLYAVKHAVFKLTGSVDIDKKKWDTKARDEFDNDLMGAKSIAEVTAKLLALEVHRMHHFASSSPAILPCLLPMRLLFVFASGVNARLKFPFPMDGQNVPKGNRC